MRLPRKRNSKALFIITENAIDDDDEDAKKADTNGKKSAFLGGLLDEGNDNANTFGDVPLPEDRVRCTLAQNDLRRLARRTNTYLQVSAKGISLRLDSYIDSTEHRLQSILHLSAKDFFVAETISTSTPVKMVGEWFNEKEHPRDSREGLLTLKVGFPTPS